MLCNTKIHETLKHVIERENGQTSSFKAMKLQKNVNKKDRAPEHEKWQISANDLQTNPANTLQLC